ncbi:hypothetical protein FHR83_007102 [Actinoplanes campanulatus]|uniref:Phage head-tail joining protein n=1 Tax=Actinoplanes campanulatus TaxID=113559 RepID=A0A7W5ANI4_9ACTN|nr:phage head-tail adapter protein [Actinoplanes campanulatus]MBB3099396.1 hypothetical protein [Actinoplanes campanulatus]GGN40172.1 hypothetical protein GCM10010109_68900 [Actinoplanes campanulatus]GID42395.1 hypothetical protein Aca09nite_89010 [Actinoplanes campanulatus]
MSFQRRRHGQPATVYQSRTVTDSRGNDVKIVDLDAPIEVRAVFIPQRSSKAEVPGQAQINVYRMIVRPDLPGVDLWSRVTWNGRDWDVVTPPSHRHGTRRTRHWSIDIRERP